jgi:hypothetical protein
VDGTAQYKTALPAEPTASGESHTRGIFGWFAKTLPQSFFESLKKDFELAGNSCIFTLQVTSWLMIVQRLCPEGTLATAVGELLHGNGRELLDPCKRVRDENISAATGAFSQARQRIPAEAARRVTERTFEQLARIRPADTLRDRLFLLDGSSIRLAHAPAVVKEYPPAKNQHGDSHWPVMRVVVMHHVVKGLAMAPYFGPMYGPKAVGEQELAEALIDRLPESSVLIGDRNFGVFSVAWHAHKCGHKVLVRLSEPRAGKLNGGSDPGAGTDRKVTWQPGAGDRRGHRELTGEERVEGRLIAIFSEEAMEILYLFTTLEEETAETVAALYKERWHIETDLRSLKEQVRLHTIPARSPELIACELLMAIACYNLIRALMSEAAQQIGIEPRRLSFSRSREMFRAFSRGVAHVESEKEFERRWNILIRSIGQCRLPKRYRPPAPREVWPIRQNFPSRKVQKP